MAIIVAHQVCFTYLAALPNAGGSKLSDVENEAKFRTFCPPPVKIREGVGEISGSMNEASLYDRTSGIHLMAVICADAGRRMWIKERKKESTAAFIEAFRHTMQTAGSVERTLAVVSNCIKPCSGHNFVPCSMTQL